MDQQKFTKEEVNAALEIIHKEYFSSIMALLSHTEQTEVSYVNVPVVTPQGGTYLVSILHVDGPKFDLTSLRNAAENKNPPGDKPEGL